MRIIGTFRATAGEYPGRWFDEAFNKEESEIDRTRRLLTRLQLNLPDAEQRLDPRTGRSGTSTALRLDCGIAKSPRPFSGSAPAKKALSSWRKKSPSTQIAPQLYDLTSLQREANSRFGFSAKRTLQIAQGAVRETQGDHLSAHRFACVARRLHADGKIDVRQTRKSVRAQRSSTTIGLSLTSGFLITRRSATISPFIPTDSVPRSLDNNEQAIFDMVTKRFVAVFFPPAQYENTTRITRVEGEPFKTEGKIMVAPGWLEVYGRETPVTSPKKTWPAVQQGERVETVRIEINTEQTRPPVRYNEGTILSAMEAAGKLVEDEELRDAMKEKGLGTPATRASIIETLISAHYLTRHGKELQPTAKAIQTITLLKNAVPGIDQP
jgi:DNA topoisomerase-3